MIPGTQFPKTIHYPEELPVSQRRNDIATAITQHQVVIVSGETGSGKTTQLPKICLELGRGLDGMIGHTQPRRLAATSVARRVAQELDTPLGEWVGYQIRFTDRTTSHTAIKLMTDGILLAESQRDPMLRRYDTIIIDEAHERSLNIDFLLGFLKQLLSRRPDLKLIITSATIDAKRFAEHFSEGDRKVPVIDVSGRMYPVEVVYQPVADSASASDDDEELDDGIDASVDRATDRRGRSARRMALDDERDLVGAVVQAVSECQRRGPGDVLVFLPGEREIREAAEALQGSLAGRTEVLPLYARLTRSAQERIFSPKTNMRRVVLATNVAETSLTVPGIRYVVDSGLARVKRYSWRNKVEQLHIERISQASANQRAGRCGRIGPGICIRLYDEDDYNSREAFTDPEILRSSLAAVILRMKVLGLDDIDTFPFVDMPHRRAITDGYQTLQELGALDDQRQLTATGKKLARLPLDPRLARMILAAHEQDCLTEMLVIVSALSVQDPRERPFEARDAARQAHSRFRDKQSEFVSYLNIWQWVEESYAQRETQRQFQAQLRKAFLSPARMREWRDVHGQLKTLMKRQRWRFNGKPPTAEQLHTALLAGLLGNIGARTDEAGVYQGARGVQFVIHPGSDLAKKGGRWIMAGELVETSRLFARCVARIEPRWIEKAGGHLVQRQWDEPRWEKRRGQVVASERGILYGLTIYRGRRVHYGRIDPVAARDIFLREGLVAGEIRSSLPFLRHNRRLIREIEALEHTSRRPDILIDPATIEAFYDEQIPAHICQTATLERWHRKLDKAARQRLLLRRDDLMRHDAHGITADVFPKTLDWFGMSMPLSYHFEPGSPRDGITLTIPLYALNQVDELYCEWLVPGMLKEKVEMLIRSLPLRLRRACVPIPDYAQAFHERWFDYARQPEGGLLDAVALDMLRHTGVRVQRKDFKPDTLAAHLHMNFKVVDEKGRFVSGGRDLDALRQAHRSAAQKSFSQQAAKDRDIADDYSQTGLTSWSFGPLPEQIEVERAGQTLIGYPALVDRGTHCDLLLADSADKAGRLHRQGLCCLFRLALKEPVRALRRHIRGLTPLSLMYLGLGSRDDLEAQLIDKTITLVCLDEPWPHDADSFKQRCKQGRPRLMSQANELIALVEDILKRWRELQSRLQEIKMHTDSHADITAHQAELMHKRFIIDTPYEQLQHFPRYLKAMQVRIDKLLTEPRRDSEWMAAYLPLDEKYRQAREHDDTLSTATLDRFYWLLQELRVGLFAQELRTPRPVSVKRLERIWSGFSS